MRGNVRRNWRNEPFALEAIKSRCTNRGSRNIYIPRRDLGEINSAKLQKPPPAVHRPGRTARRRYRSLSLLSKTLIAPDSTRAGTIRRSRLECHPSDRISRLYARVINRPRPLDRRPSNWCTKTNCELGRNNADCPTGLSIWIVGRGIVARCNANNLADCAMRFA